MTILIMLGTFALVSVSFYFGYIFGKKERREQPVISDEQRRKAEKIHKGYQALMSYDVTTAMGRGLRDGAN